MPTPPIDTHIDRVSKRLGFARKGAGYEEVRGRLQTFHSPEAYGEAHLLLIQLGRRYCKARRAHCQACPVARLPKVGLRRLRPYAQATSGLPVAALGAVEGFGW